MESKKGALQGTGRTGRRAREQLCVKDVLLALGGGPHHYPHYPNWAQQCLVTFIIIDHAYADERVCAHDLSLGWFRCRGNIETKSDNFCDAKTSEAVALCLCLVHRHPRNEKKGICSFFCFLLRKCVHSSGKLHLCGVIKGTDSSPKLATTPPVECVCSARRRILTSALFLSPSDHVQGSAKHRREQEAAP